MVASVVRPFIRRQHFQRTASLKLLGQFEFNFTCSLQGKGGKKIYSFRSGHMTKRAAMPISLKNYKQFSPPEPLDRLP